jgi:hypothetical protein
MSSSSLADILIDKESQRNAALDENTAQQVFEEYLASLPKNSKEVNVKIPLHGHLNLGVIAKKAFPKLRHLLFGNGRITSISNIPEKIEILHCEHNLLSEIKNLPETLKDLHLSYNLLSKIDLSKATSLENAYLSYNQLTVLHSLPKSLLLLKCDHNHLTQIHLENAIFLRKLYCDGNPQLKLENIPETVVDGNFPQVLKQNLKKQAEIVSQDYLTGLSTYFRLKSDYEQKLLAGIKKKKKELPKCVGCEKNVGMIFSNKDKKYSARCGGAVPCPWNLILNRGQFVPREDLLYTYYHDVEDMKERIIQHKMATLFRHIGEKEGGDIFKKQMAAFNSANKYLTELMDDDFLFNDDKKEKMKEKQYKINSELDKVKKFLKEDNVREAVSLQYKEILPLSRFIQRNQYEVMRVDIENEDDCVLVQQELSNDKYEVNLGDATSIGQI